jgi:hypothetical protein
MRARLFFASSLSITFWIPLRIIKQLLKEMTHSWCLSTQWRWEYWDVSNRRNEIKRHDEDFYTLQQILLELLHNEGWNNRTCSTHEEIGNWYNVMIVNHKKRILGKSMRRLEDTHWGGYKRSSVFGCEVYGASSGKARMVDLSEHGNDPCGSLLDHFNYCQLLEKLMGVLADISRALLQSLHGCAASCSRNSPPFEEPVASFLYWQRVYLSSDKSI